MQNEARELDNLICNYFGHDYDLIDDSEALLPKIEAYNRQSGKAMQLALLEDVEEFLSFGEQLDSIFHMRYDDYFYPSLWGTTPRDFLLLVRDQVKYALQGCEKRR